MNYDGAADFCGANSLGGGPIEILEFETDNGDGTTTVIVQASTTDGTAIVPVGTECAPGVVIDVVGSDLAKQDAGGPGIPGDSLDPDAGYFAVRDHFGGGGDIRKWWTAIDRI